MSNNHIDPIFKTILDSHFPQTSALKFAELDASDACQAFEDALANSAQTSLPDLSHPRSLAPVRWVDSGRCNFTFHYFARDEAGNLQGFHSDDQICDVIEFNLKAEAA